MFNTPDKENAMFLGGHAHRDDGAPGATIALVLSNYILGGGPASPLFGRIRGAEGLSLWRGLGFLGVAAQHGGELHGQRDLGAANRERVEASFRDELTKVLRERYTDEVAAASRAGSSASGCAHAARWCREYARPLDARGPRDNMGRRLRSARAGVDEGASARRNEPPPRREQDDVHAPRRQAPRSRSLSTGRPRVPSAGLRTEPRGTALHPQLASATPANIQAMPASWCAPRRSCRNHQPSATTDRTGWHQLYVPTDAGITCRASQENAV